METKRNGEAWWSIDWNNRDWLPMPCELQLLKEIAEQLGNFRSRKPGRLIYLYAIGWTKEAILEDLRIDERTVAKYFQKWIEYGVPGGDPSPGEYSKDLIAQGL